MSGRGGGCVIRSIGAVFLYPCCGVWESTGVWMGGFSLSLDHAERAWMKKGRPMLIGWDWEHGISGSIHYHCREKCAAQQLTIGVATESFCKITCPLWPLA